mgnify:CR=1 FL=1
MKKVYICSPCRGDYENNIQRAKEYSRAAVEKGVIPVTPHIYLTQFMDDNVPEERELALKIGSELVLGCSELWAFGIDHPSAGMAAEIELAKAHGIPVRNGFEKNITLNGATLFWFSILNLAKFDYISNLADFQAFYNILGIFIG